MATFVANRGECLDRLGRHEEARLAYRGALAIEERAFGQQSTVLAYPLAGLGQSYLAEHRPAAALAPLERAWQIRESHETDTALVAETDFALAQALWEAGGDQARAVRLATSALKLYAARPNFADQAGAAARWLATHKPG